MFVLRVVSPSGAILRESVDISTSRAVYLLPLGSVITAYERKITVDGAVRYRTTLGWLSEFRRDKEKAPLMELLDVLPSDENLQIYSIARASVDGPTPAEFMTLRQAAGFAMGRIHVTLRHVATNLSRSMVVETPTSRSSGRAFALADGAQIVSSALSRIVKGLCESSFDSMDDTSAPKNLTLFKESNKSQEPSQETPTKISKKHEKSFLHAKFKRSVLTEEEEEPATESVSVDAAAICLYQGAVMKFIVLPIVDDQTSSVNLVLLERFLADNVIDSIIDSFAFVLAVLHDSLSGNPTVLSTPGRCALAVVPMFLSFLRKISARDTLTRAPTVGLLQDTKEADFLYRLYLTITARMIPFFRIQLFAELPSDLQKDWLSFSGNLIASLRTPLSPTTETLMSPFERLSSEMGQLSSIRARRAETALLMAPFVPSPGVIHSLAMMGFEEISIIEAATSLRSNNIDEIMDRINTLELSRLTTATSVDTAAAMAANTTAAQSRSPASLALTSSVEQRNFSQLEFMSPTGASTEDEISSPLKTPQVGDDDSVPRASSTEAQLSGLAEVVERRSIQFVLRVCDDVELVTRWSPEGTPQDMLAPQLASFVCLLKTITPVTSLNPVLNHLLMRIIVADKKSGSSLHCLLHLLLLLIRKPDVSIEFGQSFFIRVYDCMVSLLDNLSIRADMPLPAWVCPALLLLNEQVQMMRDSNELNREVKEEFLSGFESETKLDSKIATSNSSDAACDIPLRDAVCKKLDEVYMVSHEHRKKLLCVVMALLKQSSSDGPSPDLCHSLILSITTLSASQSISTEFVAAEGWAHILSLPKKSAFRDSSVLLSILTRRCFETNTELKLSMTLEIRNILKVASSTLMPGSMRSDNFLELTRGLYTRSPDLFFEVLASCTKFIRNADGTTFVHFIEEEKTLPECTAMDDQTHKTLAALMSRVLQASEDEYLFTSADALDALSDCTLSLRSFPSIIAKYNCPINSGFCSLPTYMLKNFLDVNLAVISKSLNRLKASFRLLCVLCSHRGLTRRSVLDAILGELQLINSQDEEHDPHRLRVLRHLGTLISYVMKTTRSNSRETRGAAIPSGSSNQNICVDIVQHLISGKLTYLLTDALGGLVLSNDEARLAFEALMDPLETITRPQLLSHLNKANHKPARDASAETRDSKDASARIDSDTRDDVFDNSTPSASITAYGGTTSGGIIQDMVDFLNRGGELEGADEHEEGDEEDDEEGADEVELLNHVVSLILVMILPIVSKEEDEDEGEDDGDDNDDDDDDEVAEIIVSLSVISL
jgi:hypothetical protein